MKNTTVLSVIIPTFNRSKILAKVLTGFTKQTLAKNKFELIIINDGFQAKTKQIIQQYKHKLNIKYFNQSGHGPAAARNLGIVKANGKIMLFCNDDMIPDKKLCDEHFKIHQKYNQINYAVLGFTTWPKDLKINPFMSWLVNGGPQFSYYKIKGQFAHWSQAWTCNLSYKKDFLLKFGLFDPDFIYPAWEDIELAYRLNQHGLKLIYNQKAVNFHYHPTTLKSIKEKMKQHGASTVILSKKIKKTKDLPPLAQRNKALFLDLFDRIIFLPPLLYIIEKFARFGENYLNISWLYQFLLLHYRIIGRREYLKHAGKSH